MAHIELDSTNSFYLTATHNKEILPIKFTLSGAAVNNAEVKGLFQILQDKLDAADPVALQLLVDMRTAHNTANTVRVNNSGNNEWQQGSRTLNFDFNPEHMRNYSGVDGSEHKFTKERVFSHEIGHVAGELTTPDRLARNMNDRDMAFHTATGGSRQKMIQGVEEPNVPVENYLSTHFFGAAAGPARATYVRNQSMSEPSSEKELASVAMLKALPDSVHEHLTDFDKLAAVAAHINTLPEQQRPPLQAALADKANKIGLVVEDTRSSSQQQTQELPRG